MILTGIADSEPVERRDPQGRRFFAFRLKEEFDAGEYLTQSWFTVHAYIEEHLADLVSPGHWSRVSGRLEIVPYITQEGSVKAHRFVVTREVTPFEPVRAARADAPDECDLTA